MLPLLSTLPTNSTCQSQGDPCEQGAVGARGGEGTSLGHMWSQTQEW